MISPGSTVECAPLILTIDVDGTLLNTEDLYTVTISEILAKFNKGPLTWDVKLNLQGVPGPQANQILIDTYDLPLSVAEYTAMMFEVLESKWPRSEFLPGAVQLIKYLHEKKIPIAVGTSSNSLNYQRKTSHHPEFSLFGEHLVRGDDPRIKKGKPAPDIWHVCLESINAERRQSGLEEIAIEECLIFEDAVPGVVSGIASGGTVIYIPHPEAVPILTKDHRALVTRGEILDSLDKFDSRKYGL